MTTSWSRIQRDDAGEVWHAGHVEDVPPLDDGTILLGADHGDVWHLSAQGNSSALSNSWDNLDVRSLAFGPAGHQHVFAVSGAFGGKGALWVTNPQALDPLSAWPKIATLPDATRGIVRILPPLDVRRIVGGAQGGLWWAAIPDDLDPAAYDLMGELTSAPAACAWVPGRVGVSYREQNDHLWHRGFDGGRHTKEDLGGVLTDAPAACTWGAHRLDAFYRGQNTHPWHRWFPCAAPYIDRL
jgi:hypothetical protein